MSHVEATCGRYRRMEPMCTRGRRPDALHREVPWCATGGVGGCVSCAPKHHTTVGGLDDDVCLSLSIGGDAQFRFPDTEGENFTRLFSLTDSEALQVGHHTAGDGGCWRTGCWIIRTDCLPPGPEVFPPSRTGAGRTGAGRTAAALAGAPLVRGCSSDSWQPLWAAAVLARRLSALGYLDWCPSGSASRSTRFIASTGWTPTCWCWRRTGCCGRRTCRWTVPPHPWCSRLCSLLQRVFAPRVPLSPTPNR